MTLLGKRLLRTTLVSLSTFILVLLLWLPAGQLWAAETGRTVRVGIFPFAGFYAVNDKGDRSGYGYELLQILGQHANFKYVYIDDVRKWRDMEQMLLDGRLDLLTCVQKTPVNETRFAYSKKPIGTSYTLITAKAGNTAFVPGRYETYNGVRVGALRGNVHAQKFAAFARQSGFTYTPLIYDSLSTLEKALQDGQIDLMVSSSLRQIRNEWVVEQFDPAPYYLMLRKDDKKLQADMDQVLNDLEISSPNWRSELFNRYYTPDSGENLQLTPAERSYLETQAQTVLKVAICPDNAPYSYVENGETKGIIPDIFAEIARRAGFKYQVVNSSVHHDYHALLETGKVDLIMDSGWDYSEAEQAGYKLTSPYVNIPLTQVSRIDFAGVVRTVAVPEGAIMSSLYRTGLAQKYQIKTYPSVSETIKAVVDSACDAAFLYNEDAQNYLANDVRHRLRITLLPNVKIALSVASSAANDYLLLSILNKSVESVKGDYVNGVIMKYTVAAPPRLSLTDYLYLNPNLGFAIIFILALLILAVIIIAYQRAWYKKQQSLTEQMQKAKQEADQANQAKSAFLSSMSHDLRTPLNAIVGFTDIALHDQDQAARQAHLEKIQLSSNLLLALVNDTLDLSRIENGKYDLEPERVSSRAVFESVLVAVLPLAEQKGVAFKTDIGQLRNPFLFVDRLKLQKLILNLLSNAVKFTPAGGTVTFTAVQLTEPVQGMTHRITVADTGIGMSTGFQEHLYEPFSQERRSEAGNVQGTGLGLSLVKHIVDLFKGQITITSQVGQGTTVTVLLPLQILAEPMTAEPAAAAQVSLAGKRVLLCEDNALNTEIATILLRKQGMQVESTVNGREGLDKFQASAPGYYDVILMDLRMPVMDGYEATRALRALERDDAQTVPVIAMTADAFAENIKEAREAGMNGYVTKPVIPEILFAELRKYCGNN